MAFVSIGLLLVAGAAALALTALEDNVVFFFTPSQLEAKGIKPGQNIRLGGFVEKGSVRKLADGVTNEFKITDKGQTVTVRYKGVLPDLFRECQGVVAMGALKTASLFEARQVLAKHDENYMPKELADELKKQGVWHKNEKAQPGYRAGKPSTANC